MSSSTQGGILSANMAIGAGFAGSRRDHPRGPGRGHPGPRSDHPGEFWQHQREGRLHQAALTEDVVSCTAADVIKANALGGGSSGAPVSLLGFLTVTANCTVQARGNMISGKGGPILVQSFNQNVIANGNFNATPGGVGSGSINLTACTTVASAGGTFNPAAVTTTLVCVPAPTQGVKFVGPIPACTPGCLCISSFTPSTGAVGTVVTVRGDGLSSATQFRFSADCDPASGVSAGAGTQSGNNRLVTVPAGLLAGLYHIIGIGATGSFCTANLFTVP